MTVTAQQVYEVFRRYQLLVGSHGDWHVPPATWEEVSIEDRECFAIIAVQLNIIANIPVAAGRDGEA